ncbi:hypothetical protein KGP65_18240 [Burkholderia multivorans]|uniref:hypothetical protein n=1 Tax=Burkholderia multivorans TaxID=87883 RepID=UPI0012D9EAAD|nr:hypothetical protein [Burkholderia multivorans]MBU9205302.1 hypothetical protein [Burkholderia multivorans]MCA8336994.1 hypothetical protein [Burkholderia multivorans]MCA8388330.1 hypothetical protein [Burkholderia multivorans]MCO8318649.1 hypothetical protein [Burkholderia multivorans]MCO8353310.1 hypothetical protein [Burkholderia multivorans]
MREISIQDLRAVSGAVGPAGAIFGGLASGASYLGQASVTGQGNPGGFASAILAGAALGFFTGSATPTLMQAGAMTILSGQLGFYSGMAAGFLENATNSAGTNYNAP